MYKRLLALLIYFFFNKAVGGKYKNPAWDSWNMHRQPNLFLPTSVCRWIAFDLKLNAYQEVCKKHPGETIQEQQSWVWKRQASDILQVTLNKEKRRHGEEDCRGLSVCVQQVQPVSMTFFSMFSWSKLPLIVHTGSPVVWVTLNFCSYLRTNRKYKSTD